MHISKSHQLQSRTGSCLEGISKEERGGKDFVLQCHYPGPHVLADSIRSTTSSTLSALDSRPQLLTQLWLSVDSTAPSRLIESPPLTKDRNTKPEIPQDRRECDGALGPLPKLRPISTRPGAIHLVLQLVYSPLSGDATSFFHPRLRGPPTGFSVSPVVHMPGTNLDGVLRRV